MLGNKISHNLSTDICSYFIAGIITIYNNCYNHNITQYYNKWLS